MREVRSVASPESPPMTATAADLLAQAYRDNGSAAVFSQLVATLRERQDYHKLFDALCLQKKQAMGLSLGKPTSLEDVPAAQRDEFERTYIAVAREVGQLLLDAGKIGQAWIYFHAIREPQAVRDAIEKLPIPRESTEQSEELLELSLFKGVHPVQGVKIMLRTHGTCSTITSLDQTFPRLSMDDRAATAALLVRTLYDELTSSVEREIQQRMPFAAPAKSLRDLIAGREWLFADNNYHIDVSHLSATVRFARSLNPGVPELELARDLCEYGSLLAPQFQYAGEPPFQDYYPAHRQYFRVLMNDGRDEALAYFRQQLDAEPDGSDQALIAYVLVDLLVRIDRFADALPLAEQYLLNGDADFAAAFTELCEKAGRYDVLQRTAAARDDLVTYVAALVQGGAA
jgi:hypothetical protein